MGDVNESLEGLNKAIDRLIEDRDAALRRAEAAEAERRDAERRENAAYLEREQSARLRYRAEVALLRWDTQAIGAALGLPIGADVPDRAVGAIKTLRERIQMAESERDRCCDDYQREASRAEKAEAEVARFKGLLERAAQYIDQTGLGAAIYEAVKREAGAKPPEPWARTVPATNHPAGDVVKPPEPYTPRVGDVVLFDGERAESAEASPRVVTSVEPDGWWSCVHLNRRRDAVACGPFRISGRIGEVRLHRPATPAERPAAGLPVESEKPCGKCGQVLPEPPGIGGEYRCDRCGVPTLHDPPAQPQVLPEHLAWMEADAAWACSSWSTDFDAPENKKRHDEAILAARALRAAVARRDGGQK